MNRLTVLQTAIPDYRGKFFALLREQMAGAFALYGGVSYFEPSVLTDQNIEHIEVRNNYFLGRRLLFQRGVKHLSSQQGVLVIELNPRILSNWYLLLSRKRKKLPTLLWGHAWSRSGKESKTDVLRQQMRKLADGIIVYTNQQKNELQEKMPDKDILSAPNALFYKDDMESLKYSESRNIIYVGRLTTAKKPLFLIKAFAQIISELPKQTKLIIVGDGEERNTLDQYIVGNNLRDRVEVLGHISEYDKLKQLYAGSLFSVSPGYVGLSITQSLGFGVPMLISKSEPHSPELEAVKEGVNAVFYKTDDAESFKHAVLNFFKDYEQWTRRRDAISLACRTQYSVEVMVERFIKMTDKHGA